MSAVVQIEECFVAVIEPLDSIEKLRQSSLYAQNVGITTILYGVDEEFFDNLREAQETGAVILRSFFGSVGAIFKY